MILPPNINDWPVAWLEIYRERAAIMEYDGNMPRPTAEREAELDTRRAVERNF